MPVSSHQETIGNRQAAETHPNVFVDIRTLPVIVDQPGLYRTRDGRRVTVHEVKPYPGGNVTAFTVKGSVWRMFRGENRPKDY